MSNFLDFIRKNNDIFIENYNIFGEIDFFIGIDSKISFTDAAVVMIARDYGLDLITFDKQMIGVFQKLSI